MSSLQTETVSVPDISAKDSLRSRSSTNKINSNYFDYLRCEALLVDVMIVCRPRLFPAHRLILAAASNFFEYLLVEDSIHNTNSTLDLEDVDGDTMEALLEFVYTGQVKPRNLDTDYMIHLMTTAHLLQIHGGGVYFCRSLLSIRPCRNLVIIWDWTEEFDSLEVVSLLIAYIIKNMHTIWKYRDFCELNYERLVTILSQPAMETVGIQYVLSAILTWIKYDLNERKSKLSSLTPYIAFERLPEEYVLQVIEEEPMLRSCPDLKHWTAIPTRRAKQISQVTKTTMSTLTNTGTSPVAASESAPTFHNRNQVNLMKRPRVYTDRSPPSSVATSSSFSPSYAPTYGLRSVSGTSLHTDDSFSIVPKHSNRANRISSCTTNPTPICDENVNNLLLVAGRDDSNRFVLQTYSLKANTWTDLVEVQLASSNQEVMAYYKGNVIIIGGEDSRKVKLRDVAIFNLRRKELRLGHPMRLARAAAGIAQNGELIYIVGGISRFGKPMTHVECYNATGDTWQILPAVKEKRIDPGLAVLNDRIYLIGGDTRRCEVYEPNSDSWHNCAPLPEQLRQLSVAVAANDGKLFAFRCYRPDRACCYDPDRNHWHWVRANGRPPDLIRAVVSRAGEIWALDKTGKIQLYSTKTNTWDNTILLSHCFTKPMHLCFINNNDI